MSETLQYTIVGVILLLAIAWAAYKTARITNGKESGCSGCSLSDSCKKVKDSKCPSRDKKKVKAH